MSSLPNSKQDLLMVSLTDFYKNKNKLKKMIKIIHGNHPISLRILDWFVTNYSKKNNIIFDLKTKDYIQKFNVYLDYKSQLKAYSKKQFDPFCRRERISFYDHDNNEIETTVGQLNFFRWAIENNVISYVEDNIDTIESDMNESLKIYTKKKPVETDTDMSEDDIKKEQNKREECEEQKKRKKRHELSISATKTVNKHDVKIIVQFD